MTRRRPSLSLAAWTAIGAACHRADHRAARSAASWPAVGWTGPSCWRSAPGWRSGWGWRRSACCGPAGSPPACASCTRTRCAGCGSRRSGWSRTRRSSSGRPREFAELVRVLDALHLRARVADEVAEQSRRTAEHASAGVFELLSGLVAAEEATRGQLSAELHDTVAQSLAVARSLLADVPATGAADRLERVQELVEDAEEQVRAVMARTRPAELRDGDLASAVGALRREFASRYLVTVRLSWPEQPYPLPLVSAVTVYRFFQEASAQRRQARRRGRGGRVTGGRGGAAGRPGAGRGARLRAEPGAVRRRPARRARAAAGAGPARRRLAGAGHRAPARAPSSRCGCRCPRGPRWAGRSPPGGGAAAAARRQHGGDRSGRSAGARRRLSARPVRTGWAARSPRPAAARPPCTAGPRRRAGARRRPGRPASRTRAARGRWSAAGRPGRRTGWTRSG